MLSMEYDGTILHENHVREDHDIFRIIIIFKRIKSYYFLLLISKYNRIFTYQTVSK
ncbi:MAG: hypothetical protein HLUCCX10_04305 [Algoriphagus marincola HL-49]|uniref:Uncharacterized protein n=1 Tax=Algoriphagus marincola HL-49 TaxID=1305737 RepID=A0A0P7YTE3_9BACT|nr:MAG: hypothetical protein HLUCCX10_04305 [Algoriphagus marincola HL-49]